MYRYLLFDLDGTLTDPKEGITRSVQYALRHYGIDEPDAEKLTPFIGPPLIDSFVGLYGFSREQAMEAVQFFRERFGTVGIFENAVLEGIPELLEALRQDGRVLAVASSKPEYYVQKILERFGLARFFTVVTGSTMEETRTAKDEVITETCLRLGLPADGSRRREILMIGDREHDILGARACGVDSMGVYIGYAEPGELERAGATLIAHTVEEMHKLLLG